RRRFPACQFLGLGLDAGQELSRSAGPADGAADADDNCSRGHGHLLLRPICGRHTPTGEREFSQFARILNPRLANLSPRSLAITVWGSVLGEDPSFPGF